MEQERQIVATIIVTHYLPRCVIAKVNGQAHQFPDLSAVFRQALALQDHNGQGVDKERAPRNRPEWAWQPSMEL
ncbi:MAG: hypothetical protein JXA93_06360 [Anaerolineae bacterium]|nr:hypothetical protein [Anaerolineae bacterium]